MWGKPSGMELRAFPRLNLKLKTKITVNQNFHSCRPDLWSDPDELVNHLISYGLTS